MMNEEKSFLKAIAAQPEDDTVRLVYADWLTENGDPNRAELIRLECNLERGVDWQTGEKVTAAGRKELRDREKELIKDMLVFKEGERPGVREFEKTPEIAAILAARPDRINFRRGLIDHLNLINTPITTLPPDLHVGRTLYLTGTRITALPPGLHVVGDLHLVHIPITTLPPGLHVGRYLNLAYTSITTLAHDLHVGGDLNLINTPISTYALRHILTMPNLSRQAKITGLESAGRPALANEARRLPETNIGPGTPPRP